VSAGPQPTAVRVFAATHPGRVREANEDAVGASRWSCQGTLEIASHLYSGPDPVVCAVADGVGGRSSGDVASALAIESLVHGPPPTGTAELSEALVAAHEAIEERGRSIAALAGMATTIAVLVIAEEAILCANVGDTRVYELSTGGVLPVSFDDKPAGVAGAQSSVITQALGGGRDRQLDPHVQWFAREPDLTFLLCSDGLTAVLSDAEISAEFAGRRPVAAVVQRLVSLSLERGAPDNVSVMAVRVEAASA
jgi:serine/threonine protein phosphatase PrpC